MSLEIRTVEPDELASYLRALGAGFGEHMDDDEVSFIAQSVVVNSTCRAAFEDGSVVATSLDEPTGLMLPGGVDAQAVAITGVSTLPTHRRRGAMRGLIEATLADAREHGCDRAALWTSQVGLYGRFGFGPATVAYNRIEVDTVHGSYVEPNTDPGRLRLIEPQAAMELLPQAYERARPDCPGDILRTVDYWRGLLLDKKRADRFVVLHEDAQARPDGFAIYKYDFKWHQGVPETRVECDDLVWANREAHAALWRYLLDLDLVKTVDVALRPPDDPIRWLLAEPRRARFGYLNDALWVHLLDVPRALAARRYACEGRLVIEVEGTRLALESSDGAAACEPTSADADLALDGRALASCHLGGHRFAELAQAGLVEERTDGGLRRADLMFQADRAPWCMGEF